VPVANHPSTNNLLQLAEAQVAAAWQPAGAVGGDYFDVIAWGEKRLAFWVGDVAGTGDYGRAAEECNKFLCANVAAGKIVTFFCAIFDAQKLTLTKENAGYCPAVPVRQNGEIEYPGAGRAVFGVLPDWIHQDNSIPLQVGDKLLFSSC